ncbi:hypothetical protein OSC27_03685 [Microbacterium sp. STN6]|uniref:hypothetical protein n=1 Tax=Microbacterium sp. STN6 TaxID=2995588 RepID=UPI00226084EF|nr:hypothetical protein [Microbacterium sp. STN6]MCX7521376.1 hypothetical protein [Microbacterium sp. STN6]
MTKAETQIRAQHAHAFLEAAMLIADLGEDAGISTTGNVIGSLAVLAGIAAADAICGAVLSERAAGQDHAEAVTLLNSTKPGKAVAPSLRRLIDTKTETQYSSGILADGRSADLVKAANRLVTAMDQVLRSMH